jgi:hypothetical protein
MMTLDRRPFCYDLEYVEQGRPDVARGQVFLMPRPVGFTRSSPAGGTTMARTPSDNSEIRHSLDE